MLSPLAGFRGVPIHFHERAILVFSHPQCLGKAPRTEQAPGTLRVSRRKPSGSLRKSAPCFSALGWALVRYLTGWGCRCCCSSLCRLLASGQSPLACRSEVSSCSPPTSPNRLESVHEMWILPLSDPAETLSVLSTGDCWYPFQYKGTGGGLTHLGARDRERYDQLFQELQEAEASAMTLQRFL